MQKLLRIVAFIAILGIAGSASTQAAPSVDISCKWAGTWVSTNQPAGGSGQIGDGQPH